MKSEVMARRYARALYELGREEGLEHQFLADLEHIASLVGESGEFNAIMVSPLYDITLKKRILSDVVSQVGVSKYMVNFLSILLDKDRFQYVEDILKAYQDILDEVSGKVKAQVISATALTPGQKQSISEVFSKLMDRKVDVDIAVDSSLIGGLVVDIEGMVYDGSIRTQLTKIKQSLKGEI